MENEFQYDLFVEGEKVRQQIKTSPIDPIIEARNLLTAGVMGQVLLALSDVGFYEFVAGRTQFTSQEVEKSIKVDSTIIQVLLEYLTGCGIFSFEGANFKMTEKGQRYMNVYTRGVLTMYLGGYNSIFFNMTKILSGEMKLDQKALDRSTKHAAMGTAMATCTFTIPKVFEVMKSFGSKALLDLGCGSGDFLISYLRLHPDAYGWGVDMSPEALAEAEKNAKKFGVEKRLKLYVAEVGAKPLPIPKEELAKIDFVTSMYMLHEFGRNGDEATISVLKALASQLPGKRLLALEVEGIDPKSFQSKKPDHYGQLDYNLIHILSRQGLPKPPERWHEMFNSCQFKIEDPGQKTGGSYIYVVQFPGN